MPAGALGDNKTRHKYQDTVLASNLHMKQGRVNLDSLNGSSQNVLTGTFKDLLGAIRNTHSRGPLRDHTI